MARGAALPYPPLSSPRPAPSRSAPLASTRPPATPLHKCRLRSLRLGPDYPSVSFWSEIELGGPSTQHPVRPGVPDACPRTSPRSGDPSSPLTARFLFRFVSFCRFGAIIYGSENTFLSFL